MQCVEIQLGSNLLAASKHKRASLKEIRFTLSLLANVSVILLFFVAANNPKQTGKVHGRGERFDCFLCPLRAWNLVIVPCVNQSAKADCDFAVSY